MTRRSNEPRILATPGAAALLGSSVLARLPLAMFSIALLVHAQRLTGSFAVAGLVSGAYAIASAASAPLLGSLVDRHGQSRVLVGGAIATAMVLGATGVLPASTPPLALVALAAATGLCTPPLAACVRSLLPAIVSGPRQLPRLFALESTLLEVTFVAGPPLALALASASSPSVALVFSGLVMLAGTLAFAAQPASRGRRPERPARRSRAGALRSAGIRTLVMILLGTGVVFGSTEVGVTAAAHGLRDTAAAGPLLGFWGAGSLLGGIVATRLTAGTGASSLTLRLTALAIAHTALILTTGSVIALGMAITLAGATIAPTLSSAYAMVDASAPSGTHTAAYSWTLTASLVGAALGSAAAGALAQSADATASFAVAAAGGAVAVAACALRGASLPGSTTTADFTGTVSIQLIRADDHKESS